MWAFDFDIWMEDFPFWFCFGVRYLCYFFPTALLIFAVCSLFCFSPLSLVRTLGNMCEPITLFTWLVFKVSVRVILFVYYLEHIQAIGVVVSAVANLVSRPLFYFIFSLLYNLKLAHCWRPYSFIYMRTLLSHGIRNTSSWFTRFFFCYFELSYAQQKRKRKKTTYY